MPSGRSKSIQNPYGMRVIREGKQLAPGSVRKKGKRWLAECTEEELKKAEVKGD